jgi:hypothetical protein
MSWGEISGSITPDVVILDKLRESYGSRGVEDRYKGAGVLSEGQCFFQAMGETHGILHISLQLAGTRPRSAKNLSFAWALP